MFLVTKSKPEFSSRVPHTAPGKGGATRSVSQAGRSRGQPPTGLRQSRSDPRGSLVQGRGAGPHLVRFCRMRGTMLAGGPALARNGCFSSSAAVARCAGSRTSRRSRKPFRDGDTCRGGRRRVSGEGERGRCWLGSESQRHCSLAVGPRPLPHGHQLLLRAGAKRCHMSRTWPQGLILSPFLRCG